MAVFILIIVQESCQQSAEVWRYIPSNAVSSVSLCFSGTCSEYFSTNLVDII